jgi:hypothetical protein
MRYKFPPFDGFDLDIPANPSLEQTCPVVLNVTLGFLLPPSL